MSSSLLTPDPGLLFWMIIAFGIVLFILSKYVFPVILDKLESRKRYIDESISAAKEAYEELEQVKVKNEKLITEAKKEYALILSRAAEKRDLMINTAKENAIKEADIIVQNARKQILHEKEEALTSIRREVAILSVDIAEKVLRERLKEKEEQMSMIERLVDEINLS